MRLESHLLGSVPKGCIAQIFRLSVSQLRSNPAQTCRRSTMMKTVTSLFQSEQHAAAAVSRLGQAGIRKAGIDTWSTPHNLAPLLEDEGVSRSDASAYVEGVLRGGTLVI